MPLRDHFRPPVSHRLSWEGFHAQWPAMIVLALARKLPPGYTVEPRVHLGSMIEIDVASYNQEEIDRFPSTSTENGVALWEPYQPTRTIATDLPQPYEYAVHVYENLRGRRLVAAIEIVSPSNKDRPEHRRAFVAKCATLLRNDVSTIIVDLVTTRHFNLYQDLMEFMGHAQEDESEPSAIYAVASRGIKKDQTWLLESWEQPLTLGETLPKLSLWLNSEIALSLDLEETYEETCRVFRLP